MKNSDAIRKTYKIDLEVLICLIDVENMEDLEVPILS